MMTSVQWPSEMAHWTIHKGGGVNHPNFSESYLLTQAGQLQQNYVSAKIGKNESSVTTSMDPYSSKGVDFLLSIGSQICSYIRKLPYQSPSEAQESLKNVVQDLLQKEQTVLTEGLRFPQAQHMTSQIKTAHKVILLFQKEMQEVLPEFFREREESFSAIDFARDKIKKLELVYAKKVKAHYDKLKTMLENNQMLIEDQRLEEKTQATGALMFRETGARTLVNKVVEEVEHFYTFFANKSLNEISEILEYSTTREGFESAILNVSNTKKKFPVNSFLFVRLDLAEEMLIGVRDILDLMSSYQPEMLNTQSIKEDNKRYISSRLPKVIIKDFFQKMLDIKMEVAQDDDEEYLPFEFEPISNLRITPPSAISRAINGHSQKSAARTGGGALEGRSDTSPARKLDIASEGSKSTETPAKTGFQVDSDSFKPLSFKAMPVPVIDRSNKKESALAILLNKEKTRDFHRLKGKARNDGLMVEMT
ncbi:MAG: hypothetical protein K2Y01_10645 [Rhabdochlamydiaceae bacterium]|nr:hypothetical protein [Rhabdochlamydiaceae bacterium]